MRAYLASLTFLLTGVSYAVDDYIEFQRLDIRSDNRKWISATVHFVPKKHPNPDGALNPKFIDEVKIDLYLCFKNTAREKKIYRDTRRRAELKEILDFYHAEVEIPTLEVNSRPNSIVFLIPLEIAQRDGFDRVQKAEGYAVDISIGGTSLELKEPVVFQSYRDEGILQSFKQQAITNASNTEGTLVPGFLVNPAYLENSPAVKFPKSSK